MKLYYTICVANIWRDKGEERCAVERKSKRKVIKHLGGKEVRVKMCNPCMWNRINFMRIMIFRIEV